MRLKAFLTNNLKKEGVNYLLMLLLVILILPSIWYLFMPGFISTDDGNWMIIRFSAFYQALTDGQFPVRFLGRLNFDYGYPVANFLYPGFMYLAVPIKLLGVSFIDTTKIIISLCMISSGIFMYLWLSKLYDKFSSFFGALLYVYLPYHIYDLSQRGSVGELLSLAVLPFTMWQIERRSLFFASLGLALLIISHNTLAILFLALIFLYGAVSIYNSDDRKVALRFYINVILFGLGISAFFWIPAITELSNTIFSSTVVSDFSNYFADYNLIGITMFVIFAGTVLCFILKPALLKTQKLSMLLLCVGLIALFFATFLSSQLWQVLPVSFVQFPFRLLSATIVCASFLLAFCLSEIEFKLRIVGGILIIVATVVLSINFLVPKKYNLDNDAFYSTNEATTTVLDEYMPKWVKEKPQSHPEEKVLVVQGEGEINNVTSDSKNISFNFNSKSPAVIRINAIYYPGWKAFVVNKQKAIFFDNPGGVMELKLTSGTYPVLLRFEETPIRVASDLLTFGAIIYLLILSLPIRKVFRQ